MKEIKLMIDGKEVQLTDEQLKMLGIKVRKNPFGRVAKLEMYYYIDACNEVHCIADETDQDDDMSFECSNYFNEKAFAEQVALHQLLYRKLLKFSYDNEYEDTKEWNEENAHWAIRYDSYRNEFCSYYQDGYKAHDVYFSSEEGANRAIREVIEPFMKEHPEFVW